MSVLVLSSLAVQDSNAEFIFFSDSSFANEDWVQIEFSNSTVNLTSSQQVNGNPGTWRQTKVPIASGGWGATHLSTTAKYDPSLQGRINSLDYSMDTITSQGFPPTRMGFGIALRQNGQYFWAPPVFLAHNNWFRFQQTGLTSDDFLLLGTGTTKPDFSDNGSLIEFGYLSSSVFSFPTFTETVGGVDNWQVTLNVTAVPEPTSLVLVSAAVAAVAFPCVRRLKRSKVIEHRPGMV